MHDTTNTIAEKFVTDNIAEYPGLTKGHVTIKWILMRCNLALDNRGDIKEHTSCTHGIDINALEREVTIKVNESDVLVLANAKNICELPDKRR